MVDEDFEMDLGIKPGFVLYNLSQINEEWDVHERYVIDRVIGRGGFSSVCSAHDRDNEAIRFAIKKIHTPFKATEYAKRVFRELEILSLMAHPNVIRMLNVFTPNLRLENFSDIYLVCPLMDCDLATFIHREGTIPENQVRPLMYQLLCGLKYMHSANIMHRDLKPQNLGVIRGEQIQLVILDLGLARVHNRFTDNEQTHNVVTCWYRAPEVILNPGHYSYAIDVWSVGCIMAEMYIDGQRPLLWNLLGEHMKISTDGEFNRRFREWLDSNGDALNIPVDIHVRTDASHEALDLLRRLLVIDPDYRISIKLALEHPYFAGVRNEQLEINYAGSVPIQFDQENDLGLQEWKLRLWSFIDR